MWFREWWEYHLKLIKKINFEGNWGECGGRNDSHRKDIIRKQIKTQSQEKLIDCF